MLQPTWITIAGDIGTYPSNTSVEYQLIAKPNLPATLLTYKFLSGELPEGISITKDGKIIGSTILSGFTKTYNFTVRVTDNLNKVSDRSFSISIAGTETPKFITTEGELLSVYDSVWVEKQIEYENPTDADAEIFVITGSLPPGLEINSKGLIRGYPKPPLMPLSGQPTTTTYDFTLVLLSDLGRTAARYTITVRNWLLDNTRNSRRPIILNCKPLSYDVTSEQYFSYYTNQENNFIGGRISGDEFYFKVLGYDFDNLPIVYEFINLPLGLVGDTVTGWIRGTPTTNTKGITRHKFSVRVAKVLPSGAYLYSPVESFTFLLFNEIDPVITWETDSNLGTITNGELSVLSVSAYSSQNKNTSEELSYRVSDGALPPNLFLLNTGAIFGRAAFEPNDSLTEFKSESTYSFEIEAFSTDYYLLSSKKRFTLTIVQENEYPVDTIYCKASTTLNNRALIDNFLNDESIIPTEYLFRPEDYNFGKANEVIFPFAYGMATSSLDKYINAIQKNHYRKRIVLGDLGTAQAKNDKNEVIYEVVFSTIIDDQVNQEGKSINKQIYWPTVIYSTSPWFASSTEIFTNYSRVNNVDYYTSLTSEQTRVLYPNSLDNMLTQLKTEIQQNSSVKFLPKWMTSQQADGGTLGFVKAWVICYTKPGYSEIVKNNIQNNWQGSLNQIDFEIDRYFVDRSSTYNYDTKLYFPSWIGLPSGSPIPNPVNENDMTILFPRKTILPDR